MAFVNSVSLIVPAPQKVAMVLIQDGIDSDWAAAVPAIRSGMARTASTVISLAFKLIYCKC